MAMPSGFLFGLLLGILIAVEFLPSFQRILESLPEHDVTSSRRLADLLDLKHIAVQLLDTVGRDSFLVVVALGRLLGLCALDGAQRGVWSVILKTPGSCSSWAPRGPSAGSPPRHRSSSQPISRAHRCGGHRWWCCGLPLFISDHTKGAPGFSCRYVLYGDHFRLGGFEKDRQLGAAGNGSQDGSRECATDSLVEKLEKGLKSGLASIHELNCGATPTLGGPLLLVRSPESMEGRHLSSLGRL